MKKFILTAFLFQTLLFLSVTLCAQQIQAEEIYEIDATLLRPPVIAGTKTIYPVTGGTVKGKINGKVLPVGGDFASFINSTTLKLDVRIAIVTDDSATIYCSYTGYVYADEPTFKIIKAGKGAGLDPSKYYFRINPVFETNGAKYDWLNHTIPIGFGTITNTGVHYKVYAIK